MHGPDFGRRWTDPELMDDPDCDAERLLRTVAQFASINRLVSRYRSILTQTVLRDMARDPGREYHLVDLGAGGCDIPVWLLRAARRRGLRLRVTALDSDPRVAAWARREHGHVAGLTVVQALASEMGGAAPLDYVFANHFLHHLPDGVLRETVAEARRLARRGVVFTDIERGPLAYWGVSLLTLWGRRRSFAFDDGRLSVCKSFRVNELQDLAAGAGPMRVERWWPSRLALIGGEAFGAPALSA